VIPSLKSLNKKEIKEKVEQVEGVMCNIVGDDMTIGEVNRALLVGAYLVAEGLGKVVKEKVGKFKEKGKPFWQRRVERNIAEWRKDLGRVEEMRKGTKLKAEVMSRLGDKYDMLEKGCLAVVTLLKNKIQAGSAKIKNFTEKTLQHRQNTLFKSNQSQVYKELSGKTRSDNPSPNADEAKGFWNGIWGNSFQHNGEAEWLDEVKEEMRGKVEVMGDVEVKVEDVVKRVRGMSNWKAPGPDGVQGYWFKAFACLHKPIANALQRCIVEGNVPEWMVTGRTVLIQKDPAKGTEASNYRPIACLPLMWKLLSGIFADRVYTHLLDNQLLPEEQKGGRKKSRGTKDQLFIDKAILKEVKRLKGNVAMSWIDYKKAYDMVPHSWIKEILSITGVAANIQNLVMNSMEKWGTLLTSNGNELGKVDIKRGIFQGDSFSPLLFIMALIPLTMILRKVDVGYRFSGSREKVNHLLFMDDLKLYGRNEGELERLTGVVKVFSDDIGMRFGLEKCGVLVVEKGVKKKCEGIVIPGGEMIKEVDESGYKYLGVLQAEVN
ncbi:MAG: RNA-directed DNA polymerase, partial [Pseudomonadales bacterium]